MHCLHKTGAYPVLWAYGTINHSSGVFFFSYIADLKFIGSVHIGFFRHSVYLSTIENYWYKKKNSLTTTCVQFRQSNKRKDILLHFNIMLSSLLGKGKRNDKKNFFRPIMLELQFIWGMPAFDLYLSLSMFKNFHFERNREFNIEPGTCGKVERFLMPRLLVEKEINIF